MSDTTKEPDKPRRAVKRPGDPNRRRGVLARPGTSKRGPLAVKIRLRQRDVLQLRRKGLAYETIAKQIGISDSQVERDVTNALAAAIHEPAHAVFKMEMQRLDEMFASRYDAALQGDDNAYYACLAVMKHRDQLLGWIGAGREIAAKLTLSGQRDGPDRKLNIEFVIPTSNGGQRVTSLEDLSRVQPPMRTVGPPPGQHYQPSNQPDAQPKPAPPRIDYDLDLGINKPNSGVPIMGRKTGWDWS
jgi:DNA-binding CsgD family transcriptional regulator